VTLVLLFNQGRRYTLTFNTIAATTQTAVKHQAKTESYHTSESCTMARNIALLRRSHEILAIKLQRYSIESYTGAVHTINKAMANLTRTFRALESPQGLIQKIGIHLIRLYYVITTVNTFAQHSANTLTIPLTLVSPITRLGPKILARNPITLAANSLGFFSRSNMRARTFYEFHVMATIHYQLTRQFDSLNHLTAQFERSILISKGYIHYLNTQRARLLRINEKLFNVQSPIYTLQPWLLHRSMRIATSSIMREFSKFNNPLNYLIIPIIKFYPKQIIEKLAFIASPIKSKTQHFNRVFFNLATVNTTARLRQLKRYLQQTVSTYKTTLLRNLVYYALNSPFTKIIRAVKSKGWHLSETPLMHITIMHIAIKSLHGLITSARKLAHAPTKILTRHEIPATKLLYRMVRKFAMLNNITSYLKATLAKKYPTVVEHPLETLGKISVFKLMHLNVVLGSLRTARYRLSEYLSVVGHVANFDKMKQFIVLHSAEVSLGSIYGLFKRYLHAIDITFDMLATKVYTMNPVVAIHTRHLKFSTQKIIKSVESTVISFKSPLLTKAKFAAVGNLIKKVDRNLIKAKLTTVVNSLRFKSGVQPVYYFIIGNITIKPLARTVDKILVRHENPANRLVKSLAARLLTRESPLSTLYRHLTKLPIIRQVTPLNITQRLTTHKFTRVISAVPRAYPLANKVYTSLVHSIRRMTKPGQFRLVAIPNIINIIKFLKIDKFSVTATVAIKYLRIGGLSIVPKFLMRTTVVTTLKSSVLLEFIRLSTPQLRMRHPTQQTFFSAVDPIESFKTTVIRTKLFSIATTTNNARRLTLLIKRVRIGSVSHLTRNIGLLLKRINRLVTILKTTKSVTFVRHVISLETIVQRTVQLAKYVEQAADTFIEILRTVQYFFNYRVPPRLKLKLLRSKKLVRTQVARLLAQHRPYVVLKYPAQLITNITPVLKKTLAISARPTVKIFIQLNRTWRMLTHMLLSFKSTKLTSLPYSLALSYTLDRIIKAHLTTLVDTVWHIIRQHSRKHSTSPNIIKSIKQRLVPPIFALSVVYTARIKFLFYRDLPAKIVQISNYLTYIAEKYLSLVRPVIPKYSRLFVSAHKYKAIVNPIKVIHWVKSQIPFSIVANTPARIRFNLPLNFMIVVNLQTMTKVIRRTYRHLLNITAALMPKITLTRFKDVIARVKHISAMHRINTRLHAIYAVMIKKVRRYDIKTPMPQIVTMLTPFIHIQNELRRFISTITINRLLGPINLGFVFPTVIVQIGTQFSQQLGKNLNYIANLAMSVVTKFSGFHLANFNISPSGIIPRFMKFTTRVTRGRRRGK
jgi:hypothetical protein